MNSFLQIDILLFLLLHTACSEEPEFVFRAEGDVIEMGYCFGMDYIAVYRLAPQGYQLLGNSSADGMPLTPPADLQGRVRITNNQFLLGLQISHLTHSDSGIYRRECWQNQTLFNQLTQQLIVCDREIDAEEITVKGEDGRRGAELFCNITSVGVAGSDIVWYKESHPHYTAKLILDSSVSLNLLVGELQGVVEVKDHGALLWVPSSVLKDHPQFYCVVIKGIKCLSFQNQYLPDNIDVRDIFASQGDKVVLNCPSDHKKKEWLTPLGRINETTKLPTSADGSVKSNHMYISSGDESQHFSLVIPAVSDIHSGEYSCFVPLLEVQYELVLCPKKEPQRQVVFEGGDVTLKCNVGRDESVQWYRRGTSGEDDLIQDSNIKSVATPKDLRGRVNLSEHDFSLTLSSLTTKDITVYWCIVLGGPGYLEGDEDYEDYDEQVDAAEDDNDYGEYWPDTYRCIFKQETILNKKIEGRGLPTLTSDPPAASNVTAYGVGAGLAALLVVGVIGVIVIKKRAKAPPKQRASAAGSGPNANDIIMSVDSCTERLTPNNEQNA